MVNVFTIQRKVCVKEISNLVEVQNKIKIKCFNIVSVVTDNVDDNGENKGVIEKELTKINDMISEKKPDLLIACFGCPKQEKWVYENYQKYDAKVSICAGATVDFLAGNVNRAPKWMSEHGLEWFYRFLQEPKRMFKRYFIDDVKILKLVFKYKQGD